MIRTLDKDVRSLLRSGIAVSSLTQCIDELVVNCLDAGATCITVRLDIPSLRLQVSDNGTGISRDNLEVLGERYSTSKCHSLNDLNNIKFYGFRGEAIASICDIAGNLEIVTRHKSSYKTYCKTFKNGQAAAISEACIPRSNVGTTINVYDIFSTLPVRRKLVSDVLDVERIRQRLASIALINPGISFSLYNDTTGQKCLQTRKSQSIVSSFSQLFGNLKAKSLHEVNAKSDNVNVCGYVGLQTHNSKSLQFIYINGRLLMKTRLHKLVNHILNKSLLTKKSALPNDNAEIESLTSPSRQTSDKYGIFVLNITCPYMAYDITLEPAKTLVEFEDWEKVLSVVRECVESFLVHKNLMLAADVVDDTGESQDSCDSQIDLSVYEYQSDTAKREYCIETSNIRKSLHSSLVSRKPWQDSSTTQCREHEILTDNTEMKHKEEILKESVITLQASRKAKGIKTNALTPASPIPGNETPLSVPGKVLSNASKPDSRCYFTSPNPITLKPRRSGRKAHFGRIKKSKHLKAHKDKGEISGVESDIDQSVITHFKENNTSKSNLNEVGSYEHSGIREQSMENDTEKHDIDALGSSNPTNYDSNELIQTAVDDDVNKSITSHANKSIIDSRVIMIDEGSQKKQQLHGSRTNSVAVNDNMSVIPAKSPRTVDKTVSNNYAVTILENNISKPVIENCASETVVDKSQVIFDSNSLTDNNVQIVAVSNNCTDLFHEDIESSSLDDRITSLTDNCQIRQNSNMNSIFLKGHFTFDNNASIPAVDGVSQVTVSGQSSHGCNANTDTNTVDYNCPPVTFDNNTSRPAVEDVSKVTDTCQAFFDSNTKCISNTVAENCSPVTFDTNTNEPVVEDVSKGTDTCQAFLDNNTSCVSNTVANNCPPVTFDNNTNEPAVEDVSKVTDSCQASLDNNTSCISNTVANNCPPVTFDNNTTRPTVDDTVSNVTDIWQEMYDSNIGKTIYYNVNTGNTVFECPYSQDPSSHGDSGVRAGVSRTVPLVCAPHVSFDCMPWLPRNDRHKRTFDQENKERSSSHLSAMLDQWVNPVFESTSEMDVTSLSKPAATRTSLYKAILPYRFTKDMVKDLHVIQQVDNKFIVCQVKQNNQQNEHDGLVVLLDQHAVHERIRLERLTSDLFITTTQSDSSLPSIKSSPVSPPIEIDFAPNDLLLIKRFRGELGRVGVKFVIGCSAESIESRNVIVHELPCVFVEREVSETRRRRPSVALSIVKDLIESHIEHLRQTNGVSPAIPKTISRVLSSQACHGAIKFGDSLTVQECQQLMQQLSTCDLPFQCAHGRPSIIPLIDLKLLDSMHCPLEVDCKPKLSRLTRGLGK